MGYLYTHTYKIQFLRGVQVVTVVTAALSFSHANPLESWPTVPWRNPQSSIRAGGQDLELLLDAWLYFQVARVYYSDIRHK